MPRVREGYCALHPNYHRSRQPDDAEVVLQNRGRRRRAGHGRDQEPPYRRAHGKSGQLVAHQGLKLLLGGGRFMRQCVPDRLGLIQPILVGLKDRREGPPVAKKPLRTLGDS